MNKYQEALRWIKHNSGWIDPYEFSEEHQALYTDLLERAIPKKPIEDKCPNCKNPNICIQDVNCDYNFLEYCDKCGQALDWSEDE